MIRMQLPVRGGQALDRGDLTALACDRQRQARQHPPAIHPYRARTARSLITPLLRTRELKVLAEGVQEADARLDA
jgi:hypothetical protein